MNSTKTRKRDVLSEKAWQSMGYDQQMIRRFA